MSRTRKRPATQERPTEDGKLALPRWERLKIEMDPDREPWEQQPNEGKLSYSHFCFYRDLGRRRTVRQAAEIVNVNVNYLYSIARDHQWVSRAAKWDEEQDRLYALSIVELRKDVTSRHVSVARKMMAKALERLATLDAEKLSPHALILLLDTAAKIERAALGMDAPVGGRGDTRTVVTATTATVPAGAEGSAAVMRVEVGVLHEKIMSDIAGLVSRMSPEQLSAGYLELSGEAATVSDELDAVLSAQTPPGA